MWEGGGCVLEDLLIDEKKKEKSARLGPSRQ